MACIYKRGDSPYFWIKYVDENGVVRRESTGCRTSVTSEVRQARQIVAARSLEEASRSPTSKQANWAWVEGWLKSRYPDSAGTQTGKAYRCSWRNLEAFLREKKVDAPHQLQRGTLFEYIGWKGSRDGSDGVFPSKHNTALHDLTILKVIMKEAVNRGYTQLNPCLGLNIPKTPPKRKEVFKPDEDAKIRSEILKVKDPTERQMLRASFEIARHHGCRLMETRLNIHDDVNLERNTIRFFAKGRRHFVVPLHPNLAPLINQMRAEGRTVSWDPPSTKKTAVQTSNWAALLWHRWLKSIGLGHLTFHGLRVTVITEMALAGIPMSKAKRFVNHASSAVQEIYQRICADDLDGVTSVIGRRG